MSESYSQPQLIQIRDLLLAHFSRDELVDLCFSLGIDFEDLSGSNRSAKALELVLYLKRRQELAHLKEAVLEKRPRAAWPGTVVADSVTGSNPVVDKAPLQLSGDDFAHLVGLLASRPETRSTDRRIDLLEEVFAGSPRRDNILSQINVDGAARAFSVRLVSYLQRFGQDEPGQETLGVLINKLLPYFGDGEEKTFLRGLFDRYPLKGSPYAARGVTNWRGRDTVKDVKEKVIGENTLRDIRMLELALEASRAVVRVRTPAESGSGFLAGAGLIMTNHHVIPSLEMALQSDFTFNFQLDRQRNVAPAQTTGAKIDGLFYTNPDLDITVVEIEAPADIPPLSLTRQRLKVDDRVNIIQHPGGYLKKISMQNNFIVFADARDIQYLTTTEPGSSGAPVFNNDFVVVGIHHSGGMLPEPGTDQEYLRNGGSSMIAVLEDLQQQAPEIYRRLQPQ